MSTPKKPEMPRPFFPQISGTNIQSKAMHSEGGRLPRITVLSARLDPVESVIRWLQRYGYPLSWSHIEPESHTFEQMDSADVLLVHLNSPDQELPFLNDIIQNQYEHRKPIVVVLATREVIGRTDFSTTIDDFIIDPFDPEEIDLRIKFTLWRRRGVRLNDMIVCGDLTIDPGNYEVAVRGESVTTLTLKEYELLKYLASNPERVFTREHLLAKVWDYDYIGGARTVDVHVRRLRMKIERHGIRIISTVRGVGYKFGE
ncbi:uncharacterized protein METZ01_LOCUS211974 [marine metagenome]|uniref:OmpR/PhoB-type domain-containing protein n=1 Tax=marine metagenome TaxID=408172 RepID=A0A382F840_9ZZZZ